MAHSSKDAVATPQKHRRPTAKGLGITTEKPRFPQYAILAKRLESFPELEWPENSPVQVKDLIEAGLVYTGVGDSVRCYYCGGGLRNWEVGDDPMVEHARWYPNCGHVMLVKGQKFIQSIADGESLDSAEVTESYSSKASGDDVRVDSPAFLAVKEMGYTDDVILDAIRQYRQRNRGISTYKAADICQILFEMEDGPKIPPVDTRNIVDCKVQPTEEDDSETGGQASIEELQTENDRLRESTCCKICLENLADVILLPCGHIMSCGQCAPALVKCPVCRKDVNGRVKAFYSRKIPGAWFKT